MKKEKLIEKILCKQCKEHFVPWSKKAKFCSYKCSSEFRKEESIERFWNKVDKNGPSLKKEMTNCWLWKGAIDKSGYGIMCMKKHFKRQTSAHRISWTLINGKIPELKEICHKCDNPRCVRPDHLFVGTHKENMNDRDGKNRNAKGELNGRSKINSNDVIKIRKLSESGLKYTKISNMYKIDRKTVKDIVVRKLWKHVK